MDGKKIGGEKESEKQQGGGGRKKNVGRNHEDSVNFSSAMTSGECRDPNRRGTRERWSHPTEKLVGDGRKG